MSFSKDNKEHNLNYTIFRKERLYSRSHLKVQSFYKISFDSREFFFFEHDHTCSGWENRTNSNVHENIKRFLSRSRSTIVLRIWNILLFTTILWNSCDFFSISTRCYDFSTFFLNKIIIIIKLSNYQIIKL